GCGWAWAGGKGIGRAKAFDFKPEKTESYTMSFPTTPAPSATTSPSSSAPLCSPTARSEVLPPSATTSRSFSPYRLGLSGNYRSPIGALFPLLLGGACLWLSLILFTQLSLVRTPRQTVQA